MHETDYENAEDTQKHKQRRLVFLAGSIVMAVLGMLTFLLAEDMRLTMVLMDKWTLVNLLILVLEIAASILAFGRKKEDQEVLESN